MWSQGVCLSLAALLVLSSAAFAPHSGSIKIPRSKHTDTVTAMLSESLENQRATACEGEKAALACPKHTQIQVSSTFYGRLEMDYCPPTKTKTKGQPFTSSSNACHIASALTKVTEKCEHRRKCKVQAKPKVFAATDPCPDTSKYLNIAYKCKPSEFNSASFCEGSPMELSCKAQRRLALYSAVYGRTVDSQAVECRSPAASTPLSYDCTVDVLPQLLARCHAQKECSINVSDQLLGNPCPAGVLKYLTLIFMCVNERIFNEAALKGELSPGLVYPLLPPETPASEEEIEEEEEFGEDIEPPPPPMKPPPPPPHSSEAKPNNDAAYAPVLLPEMVGQGDEATTPKSSAPASTQLPPSLPNAVGVVTAFVNTWNYIVANKDKALLYFALSAGGALAFVLIACICQLCIASRGESRGARKVAETGLGIGTSEALIPSTSYQATSTSTADPPQWHLHSNHQRMDLDEMGAKGVSFMRFNDPTPPRSSGLSQPPSLYGTYHRAPADRVLPPSSADVGNSNPLRSSAHSAALLPHSSHYLS